MYDKSIKINQNQSNEIKFQIKFYSAGAPMKKTKAQIIVREAKSSARFESLLRLAKMSFDIKNYKWIGH